MRAWRWRATHAVSWSAGRSPGRQSEASRPGRSRSVSPWPSNGACSLRSAAKWLAAGSHPAGASRLVLLPLGAAAMGMQSTAVRRLGQMSTTYLTSTLTGILTALAIRRWPAEWQRSTGVILAAVVGATLGGLAALRSPGWVPAAILVPITVVLAGSASPARPGLPAVSRRTPRAPRPVRKKDPGPERAMARRLPTYYSRAVQSCARTSFLLGHASAERACRQPGHGPALPKVTMVSGAARWIGAGLARRARGSADVLGPPIVPIITVICLAIPIIMAFYADSHPVWRSRRGAPRSGRSGSGGSARRASGRGRAPGGRTHPARKGSRNHSRS